MKIIYPPKRDFDSRGRPLKGRNTNKYIILNDKSFMVVTTRDGEVFNVEIDEATIPSLQRYSWSLTYRKNNQYYFVTTLNNKSKIKLHRFLTNCPKDKVVDHKDGNTLNNKIENLRVCTKAQNCQNSSKQKLKGFWKVKTKYQAAIRVNGKLIGLGKYPTDVEAAKAYDEAAKKYFGDFANLNFPQDVL